MHDTLRLFKIMTQAAIIFTVAYFVLIALTFMLLRPPIASLWGKAGALAVVLVIPIGMTAWWMFRKLQLHYSRQEALSAAVAFAVFSPVPIAVGLLLGQVVGGYTGLLLGTESRVVAFAGAVAGLVVMITLMTIVPAAFILWLVRRQKRLEL